MSRYRSALLFVLLAFVWGTAFVAIRAGLADLPPVLFAALRYDLAAVLMLGYAAYITDDWLPRSRLDLIAVGVSAGLIIALYNAFLFIGQQGVTSAVASILIATSPIITTALSWILVPEDRLTISGLVGLVAGFIGVVLVVSPDPVALSAGDLRATGFVLLAAASVAVGSVLLQRLNHDLSTEATVAWACAIGAVFLHLISVGIPTESITDAQLSQRALVSVGYLAVFASAIGYFVYFDLLERVGAVEINLVSYAAPVFATLFGWLLLGEEIALHTVIGFLIITCGFILLKRQAIAERVDIDTMTLGSR